MWVPSSFVKLFTNSFEELATAKAERDSYRDELAKSNILNDWLRMQVNSLQMERAELLKVAYNIKVSAPQISKAPAVGDGGSMGIENLDFEDIGDEMAKRLGLPIYGN